MENKTSKKEINNNEQALKKYILKRKLYGKIKPPKFDNIRVKIMLEF